MVTQTFSQYLSPSWQLTLQSQPSPLSQWMGEVVVRQLQFQLIRLLSPSPDSEAVSAPDPSGDRSLGQPFPPFPSTLRSPLPSPPSPDVVLAGNEQLLQHLYTALQTYVEQHLGCGLGNPTEAVLAWSGLIPVPPLPPSDRAGDRGESPWLDRQERSGKPSWEAGLTASAEGEQFSEVEETAAPNPALAVLPIETAIGPDLHQPLSLDLDAETLAELETSPGFDNYLEDPSFGQAQPQQPLCIQIEPCSALRHRLSYFPTRLDVVPPYPDGFAPLDPGFNPELVPPSPPHPEAPPQPTLTLEVTTLELFDLLDVLDQWHSSMVFLPDLRTPSRSSAQPWLKSAALVLITVGVTVGGMQIFQSRDRVALSPSAETAPSADSGLPSLGNLALGDGDPGADLEAQLNLGQAPPSPDTLGLPQVPGAPGAAGSMPGSVPLGTSQPLSQSGAVTLPPPPPPGWLTLPPPPATTAGPLAPLPTAPQVPLPSAGTGRSTAPSAASGKMAIADAAPPAPSAESLARVAPEAAASASAESAKAAIDPAITSSQVATVRSYFQSVWQAPDSLTQPLQYGLVIGPNGALQTISPQDTSAGNFLDRTGMPLLGEPFVPAAADGYNRSMNLTLYPDGRVEVYSLGAW
ncbi:MAG: hypothetical protein ACO331_03860 [Prochlorothrix sp.]